MILYIAISYIQHVVVFNWKYPSFEEYYKLISNLKQQIVLCFYVDNDNKYIETGIVQYIIDWK